MDEMNIVLVPKLINPLSSRFFSSYDAIDMGVLALGSYLKSTAKVSIKSIFGLLGKKSIEPNDHKLIDSRRFLIEYANYIISDDPNIVGISTIDSTLLNTIALSKMIKKLRPGVSIVLGGPGVYANYNEILKEFKFIDYCIIGEGEEAFKKLIGNVRHGNTKIEDIPSLAYRDNETIKLNFSETLLEVESLPYLSYELYDINVDDLTSISCEPGRGCPHRCTFCSTTEFWQKCYRVKSVDRLISEIKYYRSKYKNLNHFDFHSHDNFLVDRKYIENLRDALEKENIDITWNCSSRIDSLDDTFVELLKNSGCKYIDCGIESGSERILKLIKKNINIDKTFVNAKKLIDLKVGVAINFMIGFPTETIDELESTFEAICKTIRSKADLVFCHLSPLKGTHIYENYRDLLRLNEKDAAHDFTNLAVNSLFDSSEMRLNHPFFINQVKIFSNGVDYDNLVEKVKRNDAVYIFIRFAKILEYLKNEMGITISNSLSGIRTFPYSGNLIEFVYKKARELGWNKKKIDQLISFYLQEEKKNNRSGIRRPYGGIFDISAFIRADILMQDEGTNKNNSINEFIIQTVDDFFMTLLKIRIFRRYNVPSGFQLYGSYLDIKIRALRIYLQRIDTKEIGSIKIYLSQKNEILKIAAKGPTEKSSNMIETYYENIFNIDSTIMTVCKEDKSIYLNMERKSATL